MDFDSQVGEIILDSSIIILVVTGLFQGGFLKQFASKTNVLQDLIYIWFVWFNVYLVSLAFLLTGFYTFPKEILVEFQERS
ncbi:MAG: hypothetical protein ACFFDT_06430 [Candidatus Hodarchaeota archaeon]